MNATNSNCFNFKMLKKQFKKFGDVGVIYNVGLQIEKSEFVVFFVLQVLVSQLYGN